MKKQKIDVCYFLAFNNLMDLQNICIEDKIYQNKLKSLVDYVAKKLEIPNGFLIANTYIINELEEDI